jgi:threonyl-tRNA synthetase
MLTRIYGTAFPTKKELDDYLTMLAEAKKRDHKKIGKELGLFTFSDLVGQGLPLWTPKGTLVRDLLNDFVWELRKSRGYERVCIPHIAKRELYEKSGHWAKFSNELFKIKTREGHDFVMKPMNCPHHTQIFNSAPRSYKDMPQRYAETTMVYRDEQSGELSGLSRVRSVTQDDAHVFCRKSQMKEEFIRIWDIVQSFYGVFGFALRVRLSFHDPEKFEAYLGTPELWQEAEEAIESIAKEKKADYHVAQGEAAFYGPKMDFMTKDSLGREWQVATIQLDVNMPERFDLYCVNEKGEHERIIMLHAAIMGSIERFASVLIEHLAGAFPLWLAPVQVALLPIGEKHADFAHNIQDMMRAKGIRVVLDTDGRSIGAKIRHQTLQKVPYMGIMGDKEVEGNLIAIRTREGKDLGTVNISTFIQQLISDIENRT